MITVNVEEQNVSVECVKKTYEVETPVGGPPGKPGEQGKPGEPGPPNTLTVGTVDTGEAAATITGQSPNQELNLTLPAGGVDRLIVGTPGEFYAVMADLTYSTAEGLWLTGSVGGFVEATLGAPAIITPIPRNVLPPGEQLKVVTAVSFTAWGTDIEPHFSQIAILNGLSVGLPGSDALVILDVVGSWEVGSYMYLALSS